MRSIFLRKQQRDDDTAAAVQRSLQGRSAKCRFGRNGMVAVACVTFGCASPLLAAELVRPPLEELPALRLKSPVPPAQEQQAPAADMFLREFRLQGVSVLEPAEIERAVYPYLGPGRSTQDVERARAAVEKLYHDKGYQTVSVEIPQQKVRRGVVVLRANEVRVGQVRVRGARFHEPEKILESSPSLAEGQVPNFNEVVKDIVALNRTADRRVTPEIVPGKEPNTVDVDLKVEDSLPLHGGLELNNRNSVGTTALRLNGSLRYDNLWQMGHSVGASFQISPSDIDEVQVYSGYYTARFDGLDRWSFTLSGTKQDTNISTIGNAVSAGRGDTISLRANYMLPGTSSYFQSISFGADYKDSKQIFIAGTSDETPINYIPLHFSYSGSWRGKYDSFNMYMGLVTHFRGAGSSGPEQWKKNRYGADGNFLILRGDFSYTAGLTEDLSAFMRLHGQYADSPLISAEQTAGGGLDTVRGYYEGEVLGDMSGFTTLELRTGNLPIVFHDPASNDSFSLHAFAEGGIVVRKDPLPSERGERFLASVGVGARIAFLEHFSGSVDLGIPLVDGPDTRAGHPRAIFILRGDF